jgi:hypothetical protein
MIIIKVICSTDIGSNKATSTNKHWCKKINLHNFNKSSLVQVCLGRCFTVEKYHEESIDNGLMLRKHFNYYEKKSIKEQYKA